MNEFRIEIVPPIPASTRVIGSILFDHVDTGETLFNHIDAGRIFAAHTDEYNIIYHVGGQIFAYYPSQILSLLNDLAQEFELIQKRKPHEMTLVGYTVLEIDFVDEFAVFLDPMLFLKLGIRKQIGEAVNVSEVEAKFRAATESVFKFVMDLQDVK